MKLLGCILAISEAWFFIKHGEFESMKCVEESIEGAAQGLWAKLTTYFDGWHRILEGRGISNIPYIISYPTFSYEI